MSLGPVQNRTPQVVAPRHRRGMTLGSSSCTGEMFVIVFVIREE
ncbi:hypothetical protein A2U01_0059499, partial [Trifolium medium]|nr:hypothetical protein [Trifolium medium]